MRIRATMRGRMTIGFAATRPRAKRAGLGRINAETAGRLRSARRFWRKKRAKRRGGGNVRAEADRVRKGRCRMDAVEGRRCDVRRVRRCVGGAAESQWPWWRQA